MDRAKLLGLGVGFLGQIDKYQLIQTDLIGFQYFVKDTVIKNYLLNPRQTNHCREQFGQEQ